jgi:hypothetical protein
LTQTIQQLEDVLSDPSFYQRDPKTFEQTTNTLHIARHELHRKEERWLELLEKEESV